MGWLLWLGVILEHTDLDVGETRRLVLAAQLVHSGNWKLQRHGVSARCKSDIQRISMRIDLEVLSCESNRNSSGRDIIETSASLLSAAAPTHASTAPQQ